MLRNTSGARFISIRAFLFATGLCFASLPIAAPQAWADEVAELDLLSRATDDAGPGLTLARDQASRGDLLGAMATLERLLINHPEADEAQLLHASLLCRLDDRSGSSSEFAILHKRDFRDRAWKDANAPCVGANTAPGPGTTTRTNTGTTEHNDDGNKAARDATKTRTRTRRPGF